MSDTSTPQRVRHQVRESLLVMALSLGLSTAIAMGLLILVEMLGGKV